MPLGGRENFHFPESFRPCGDQRVGFPTVRQPRGGAVEARVVAQILAAHSLEQAVPVLLDREVHRDVTIIGRVDVDRHPAVARIAGARRHLAALPIRLKRRSECRVRELVNTHSAEQDEQPREH